MKIVSSSLQMASSHASLQQHEVRERLSMWAGDRPGRREQTAPPPPDNVHLSQAGKESAAKDASAPASDDEPGNGDPRLKLIHSLIELLTGRRFKVFDAHDIDATGSTASAPEAPSSPPSPTPPPATTAGWGISYHRHESYSEAEQTTFSASGKVTTADGREIDFSLQLSMSRSFHMESDVSLRLGDAARKTDPLVLNFSGTAAQLTDQRFAFDLNADGQAEQINFVAPGSGFLVFDHNGDGKINDGSELFGPSTNVGFQQLGALDSDRIGWIDENDSTFSQLQICPDRRRQGPVAITGHCRCRRHFAQPHFDTF